MWVQVDSYRLQYYLIYLWPFPLYEEESAHQAAGTLLEVSSPTQMKSWRLLSIFSAQLLFQVWLGMGGGGE